MTVVINYKKKEINKISKNQVLFLDQSLNFSSLKKFILKSEYNFILDILKNRNLIKDRINSFDLS